MSNNIEVSSIEKFKEVGLENVENFSKALSSIFNAYESLLVIDASINRLKEYKNATNIVLKPTPNDIDLIITKVQSDSANYNKLYSYAMEMITTFDSADSALNALSRFVVNGKLDTSLIDKNINVLSEEEIRALEYFAYTNLDDEEISKISVSTIKKLVKELIKDTAGENAGDLTSLAFAIMAGDSAEFAAEMASQGLTKAYDASKSVEALGGKSSQIGLTFGTAAAIGAIYGGTELYSIREEQGMLTGSDYVYGAAKVGGTAVTSLIGSVNPVAGIILGIATEVGADELQKELKGTREISHSGYLQNGQMKPVNDIYKGVNSHVNKEYYLHNEKGTKQQVTEKILINEFKNDWEKELLYNQADKVSNDSGINCVVTKMDSAQKKATSNFFETIANTDDIEERKKAYKMLKNDKSFQESGKKNYNQLMKELDECGYNDASGYTMFKDDMKPSNGGGGW